MDGVTKIVKSFKEFGLLIKSISETIKNEIKEQKSGFLGMLLGTLGARKSINMQRIKSRGIVRAGEGTIRPGEGTIVKLNIFQKSDKNIVTNIYGIQACDSIICGHFCIGFTNFMLKGKILLDDTNLFSPKNKQKMIK